MAITLIAAQAILFDRKTRHAGLIGASGTWRRETRSSQVQLEDYSGHEKDETRKGRNHANDMERPPAIAHLLPVDR